MFGKLVKHEFKSVGKWYLGLYAIVVVLSVLIGFWARKFSGEVNYVIESEVNGTVYSPVEGWLFGMTIFVFAILFAGIFISTLILVVTRFKNNIYGRQGYLTMTLPVTGHQIILSKLLAAVVWNILAGLMVFVVVANGGVVASFGNINGQEIRWAELFDALINYTDWGLFFLYIFGGLLGLVASILTIYFAISLGQLFKDHRTLMAVVFYFGIQIVVGMFTSAYTTSILIGADSPEVLFGLEPFQILINALLAVGFYFGTHFIMTKKLNLQ